MCVCVRCSRIAHASTVKYESSSPDESALVAAASALGYRFAERTMKSVVVVRRDGKRLEFQLLNVLEFNSTRKRMSVIVRTPDQRIVLYCKGADSVIYERLRADEPLAAGTLVHLEKFAATGLRTLCLARNELDAETYKKWNKRFHAASVALEDRNAKLDAAAAEIECNLELLGTTGEWRAATYVAVDGDGALTALSATYDPQPLRTSCKSVCRRQLRCWRGRALRSGC